MYSLIKFWVRRYKFYLLTILSAALISCSFLSAPSEGLGIQQVEQARSADSFIDSIGVAVHLDYGDTAYKKYNKIIKPKLKELGIRHIRGGVKLEDKKTLAKFNDLATIGIKSTIVMNPRKLSSPAQAVKIAKALKDSIEAVEGANEWDLHPHFQYQGKSFPEGVRAFQTQLYSAIKGNAATAHLDVLSPSMAYPGNASKLGGVACDLANMHSYAGGRMPSSQLDSKWLPKSRILCNSKLIVASESGYHNALNSTKTKHQPGVSEEAAAKYLPRLFLEYFNREIKRAYTYELIDLKPNPEADIPNWHYGLLRYDGTPKPDFIALKNTIALLQDSQQIAKASQSLPLNSLKYLLKGDITNIHHTLLQKKNGTFYLILWQEVSSFDLKTQRDILVTPRPLRLVLKNSIDHAATYEPIDSLDPIRQYKKPNRMKLQVSDHPLVIELVPNNA